MKIIVLGAGLVGNLIARDLAENKEYEITVADISKTILERLQKVFGIKGIQVDLSNKENVAKLVKDYDLVIGAVPGFMGFQTMETVIECRKDIIDISFFGEDPFLLDEKAKDYGVTAVVDCGVAPGLSNIAMGYVSSVLDCTESFLTYVGGLPIKREPPYEYKAPFSPIDVIEEYIRPARFVENSEVVIRPALSDSEFLEFPIVGTLEAFNTDGLRTIIKTMKAPNMKEKTMRYPGHIDKIKLLRDTGLLSQECIEIEGILISPLKVTSKLLIDKWKLCEGEEDVTVMKIIIEGKKEERRLRYTYLMIDQYDKEKQALSMAKTTGYTCSIVADFVAQKRYTEKGIIAPEMIGQKTDLFKELLAQLKRRGVILEETIEELQ